MNLCLDCIRIWYGCSLGISDDLPQPFKKKIDMVVLGVIFFSLFIDIDGQRLWLRGLAIMAIFYEIF